MSTIFLNYYFNFIHCYIAQLSISVLRQLLNYEYNTCDSWILLEEALSAMLRHCISRRLNVLYFG